MNKSPSPKSSNFSAKTFQMEGLTDSNGRLITYLRLAITDRCNLRCRYCRPAGGVPFIPHDEILRFEELERLVKIFCLLGISKVRVTGGEPFSRRGCLDFLARLRQIKEVETLYVTTNGVKTGRFLDDLANIGIDGINLSLDTTDPRRFWQITRRDYLDAVMNTLHGTLDRGIPLKINSVVLKDTTDAEIIEMGRLAKEFPITLRFIETMPFSGTERSGSIANGNLSERLKSLFEGLKEDENTGPTTARTFSLPGHKGKIGIIAGYSRLFCKTCNKLRITPDGMLKTCLYDNGALNLKEMLRRDADDAQISAAIVSCVQKRFANGHEAELAGKRKIETSMGLIGG